MCQCDETSRFVVVANQCSSLLSSEITTTFEGHSGGYSDDDTTFTEEVAAILSRGPFCAVCKNVVEHDQPYLCCCLCERKFHSVGCHSKEISEINFLGLQRVTQGSFVYSSRFDRSDYRCVSVGFTCVNCASAKQDAQKALITTFELCDHHVQRGVTTPFDDVVHPLCCTPNASFHLTIFTCAAVNVTFMIRANPFCVDRYVAIRISIHLTYFGLYFRRARYVAMYNDEFVDVVMSLRSSITEDEKQELKGSLKNIHTPRGAFNNSFATPRTLFDIFNKTPGIKEKAMELSFKMHADACLSIPSSRRRCGNRTRMFSEKWTTGTREITTASTPCAPAVLRRETGWWRSCPFNRWPRCPPRENSMSMSCASRAPRLVTPSSKISSTKISSHQSSRGAS